MPICFAASVTTDQIAQSLRLSPTLLVLLRLSEGAARSSIFARGLPGVDAVLHPDGDGHRAYAAALAEEVDDDPAVLPHLDVLYRERG